ncbi:MAG: DNA polymerase III subunit beta, partial [Oscillospiraceae bacterium]|nr:DNA polymerase III subunit beta [Oscillospiraceae bacterium]
VEGQGGELEIGFNNSYLLDALRAAPADKIRLCFNNAASPCVIVPTDGTESFFYMILPVRLKAGV